MSKRKGIRLIDKMTGKFTTIIDGLEKGIKICDRDIEKNNRKIDNISTENASLGESKAIASSFSANLRTMVQLPVVEKKED